MMLRCAKLHLWASASTGSGTGVEFKSHRFNHMGLTLRPLKAMLEFLCDDIENLTGIRQPRPSTAKAEVLFITPSADVSAEPASSPVWGTRCSLKTPDHPSILRFGRRPPVCSPTTSYKLNAKMYAEAKRLGVR